MSTTYNLFKFLHVVAVIVWLGGLSSRTSRSCCSGVRTVEKSRMPLLQSLRRSQTVAIDLLTLRPGSQGRSVVA
jgi:hypothetical protein